MRDDLLTIGELSRLTGRSASSIRYYEDVGLLATPVRRGGQRRYGHDAVHALAVIAAAKRAGLTLSQIKSLLDADTAEAGAAASRLRAVATARLADLTAQIEQAERARQWLEAAAACDCPTIEDCALFAEAV